MRWIPPLALLALAASCSSAKGDEATPEEEGPPDGIDPVVVVESPLRGTMSADGQVTVTGRISDNLSIDRVEVNGQLATVEPTGNFTATVPLNTGVNLVITEGFDKAGNSHKDVRAVLGGTFAPQGTPVEGALVAQVGAETLDVLAALANNLVNNLNIEGLAKSHNPILSVGNSCFGLKVDVQTVDLPKIDIGVAPTRGGINVELEVDDPELRTRWNWEVACLGGGHNVNVRGSSFSASAKVDLDLTDDRQIIIGLRNIKGDFKSFDYDIGGIPDVILNLADGPAERAVIDQLVKLTKPLPEAASTFLAEFARQDWSLLALSQIVDVDIVPSRLEFTTEGGVLELDASVELAGVAGADYLVSPSQLPSPSEMSSDAGLSLGIADDLVNMVLAGFWASGALDWDFSVENLSFLKAAFGEEADTLTVNMILPPTIRGQKEEDSIILTIGDLMIDILDTDDGLGTLATFAISAEIELTAGVGPDGRLRLGTKLKSVHSAILEMSDAIVININEKAVAGFVAVTIQQLQELADVALQTVPLPTFGDAMLLNPAFESTSGYVLVKSGLTQ